GTGGRRAPGGGTGRPASRTPRAPCSTTGRRGPSRCRAWPGGARVRLPGAVWDLCGPRGPTPGCSAGRAAAFGAVPGRRGSATGEVARCILALAWRDLAASRISGEAVTDGRATVA